MEKAIIQTEAIMIGDTKIDGILGLDYIAKRKGINITVENGEIRYQWNDETINENSDKGIDCMLMYDDVHFLTRFQCQRVTSPAGISWVNGKVERLHRIINDKVSFELA
jgi:hypothetical protein